MNKDQVRSQVVAGVVSASAYQCRPNTYVHIVTRVDDVPHTAVGFAKVAWRDKWDAQYGLAMATRKAIAKIVRAILAGTISEAVHETLDGDTVRELIAEDIPDA